MASKKVSFTCPVCAKPFENQFDIPTAKRSLMGTRRNIGRRRYSVTQIAEIRRLFSSGSPLGQVQKLFGGGFGSLAGIRDGLTYRDI